MDNHYPLWKNLLIGVVVAICALYALPNLFGEDPAVQISPAYARNITLSDAVKNQAEQALLDASLALQRIELDEQRLMVRLKNDNDQLKAYEVLRKTFPEYVVTQTRAPAMPGWLQALNAKPLYLGLDLRGGVHFLMQVDMESAIQQDEERFVQEFRSVLRKADIQYRSVARMSQGGVRISFAQEELREKARNKLRNEYSELEVSAQDLGQTFDIVLHYKPKALLEAKQTAVEQNITTLRNRVNELGVAEPVIQRQGEDRIVVQLPGIQDPARAKEILGATATLEFRLTHGTDQREWDEAERSGKVSPNARLYYTREQRPVVLNRSVIVTGDQIATATSMFDQNSGRPAVSVRLDGKGAKRMYDTTKENVLKPMAVVFIEHKIETKEVNGKLVKTKKVVEEVINVATIQEAFGKNFQITGLDPGEANNLALLLRAGALKAPVEIVEERTIGPSLGADNIRQGMYSIVAGFVLVMLFMGVRYKQFGMIANTVLLLNLVMMVALLSMLQATLTLPGIAGILLTIGMAVDANVLIFERIREELMNKTSPQASIYLGYEKAFSTILDANITTLIAGIVLFGFGSGPVKGFAVTLSLGIISSMFTAIFVSRALINWLYGRRTLSRVPL